MEGTVSDVRIKIEGSKYGVGFGAALAMAISYDTNHSIVWAIVHTSSTGFT